MKNRTRAEKYKYLTDPMEIRALHDKAAASQYRQTFHIQPVAGLLNDPNGFVYFENKWHLFYQWCPWGAVHGLKYWYHVISEDLVTWKNLGVFLKPKENYVYDNKGVFSGSALTVDDKLYLYYTGNNRDADYIRHPFTCLARMGEDGRPVKNPGPLFGPHGSYTENQRDPKIVAMPEKGCYYLILGAERHDKHGCIIVYKSEEPLRGWEFRGELRVPGLENLGNMWECPSIEHIGEYDVLMFCPQHVELPGRGHSTNHNGYVIGKMDWDNLIFEPEGDFNVLDLGFDSYAAACANNIQDDNKAILEAWMGLPDASYPTDEEKWAGCLTLPRELTIREKKLVQRPYPGLKKLRADELNIIKNSDGCCKIPSASEIEINTGSGDLMMHLFSDDKGNGGISVCYDDMKKEITVDRSGMKRRFNVSDGESRSGFLPMGLSQLRIFADRSSVEIFVNDGEAVFTSRVFPTVEERFIKIQSGDALMHIWTIKPSVKDDFTV